MIIKDKNHISFSDSPFSQWSGKLHGKIILHSLFWILFFIYLFAELLSSSGKNCDIYCHLLDNTVYLLCTMTGVYINAYFFIPKFLYRRKFILYIICFITVAVFTGSIKLYVYNFILDAGDIITSGLWQTLLYWLCRDIFEIAAISSIKIASDWIITANKLRQKEKQELQAEFRFLKAQVNPHFIFNTLNNIYFLINKNSAQAGEAIISLSNILRYRIYEPGETGSTIENELQCITDLIELEKLRLDPTTKIEFTIEEKFANHQIEPLLFIPFVENSFKHFKENKSGKWLKINFKLDKDQIEFSCINSNTPTKKSNMTDHGIGIKNITSRLKLIYPNKHNLVIKDTDQTYEVYLTIKI